MRNRQCWLPLLLSLVLQTAVLRDRVSVEAALPEDVIRAETPGYEKKPHMVGIRIEPLEDKDGRPLPPDKSTFAGYEPTGVSIVHPDSQVRVVLFGWWLDEVTDVLFTLNNCSEPTVSFNSDAFQTHLERRIVIISYFPSASSVYKICIRQKPKQTDGETPLPPFLLIDDAKTWITTRLPPRTYYLPMYLQISIILFLLILSGLFSGLNLGLMSLNPQELELIQKSGSKSERRYAETILPVRRTGNFLLCSLLIGNVLVNSAISILFDDLTSGYVALIVSSFGIVIFGEIVPQSICVKKGLKVGYQTIWITRFFMVLTFPISWPIGKILDLVLGDEVTVYDRKRLMELIKITTRSEGGHLAEELKIAVGAMEMSDKTVKDVMTKVDDVFMLPDTTVLNTKTVAEILRMGYTRIPVYQGDRNTIVALLFVKDLALLDPDDNFTIKTVCGYNEHPLRFVMEDTPLRVMLEEFKKGDYHLAIVQKIMQPEEGDPFYELTGIVTLEDIVEEILQAEIVDETDAYTDNVNRTRRRDVQARDLTRILENDAMMNASISAQLQLVTMQWLTANQPAFHSDLIAPNVLERLIRQHVRVVEFSNLTAAGDIKTTIPRTAKLYTKQEPSERFILILEGRVTVTIGQNEMQFEAGPWHSFGEEVLRKLVELAPALSQHPVPHAASALSFSRQSLAGDTPETRKRHAASFIPDFTAVVKDDCTYLEITVNSYLSAYRATLMQKGTRVPLAMSPDDMAHGPGTVPFLARQGRGSIGCVSSARDFDRRKLSEFDRRTRGGSRPSLDEISSFQRDTEGIRATIGSPKEAQKLLAALGLRTNAPSASGRRRASEEQIMPKMTDLAATMATKANARQPHHASPEVDDDETIDLRLDLDGLASVSTTPRPTTSSRTNLIVKASGPDVGKDEGDPV